VFFGEETFFWSKNIFLVKKHFFGEETFF